MNYRFQMHRWHGWMASWFQIWNFLWGGGVQVTSFHHPVRSQRWSCWRLKFDMVHRTNFILYQIEIKATQILRFYFLAIDFLNFQFSFCLNHLLSGWRGMGRQLCLLSRAFQGIHFANVWRRSIRPLLYITSKLYHFSYWLSGIKIQCWIFVIDWLIARVCAGRSRRRSFSRVDAVPPHTRSWISISQTGPTFLLTSNFTS